MSGQVHLDSEVFTAALWDAYEAIGDDVVRAVIDAIPMLADDAIFEEAAAIIEEVARAEAGDAAGDALRDSFVARGLTDCLRVVPYEELRRAMWLYPSNYHQRFKPLRPPPAQLQFDVPEGVDTLTLTFDVKVFPPPGWAPLHDLRVLSRGGAPLSFSYEAEDEITWVDAEIDDYIAGLNDGEVEIPVSPGEPVFLAIVNQGLHIATIDELSAAYSFQGTGTTGQPETSGDDTSDAGDDASGTGSDAGADAGTLDDGCSCRVDAPGLGLGWLVLALLGAGLRRRATFAALMVGACAPRSGGDRGESRTAVQGCVADSDCGICYDGRCGRVTTRAEIEARGHGCEVETPEELTCEYVEAQCVERRCVGGLPRDAF